MTTIYPSIWHNDNFSLSEWIAVDTSQKNKLLKLHKAYYYFYLKKFGYHIDGSTYLIIHIKMVSNSKIFFFKKKIMGTTLTFAISYSKISKNCIHYSTSEGYKIKKKKLLQFFLKNIFLIKI